MGVLEKHARQPCSLGTYRAELLSLLTLYRCVHSSEFFSFHGTFRPSRGGAHRPSLCHDPMRIEVGLRFPPFALHKSRLSACVTQKEGMRAGFGRGGLNIYAIKIEYDFL